MCYFPTIRHFIKDCYNNYLKWFINSKLQNSHIVQISVKKLKNSRNGKENKNFGVPKRPRWSSKG